MWLRNCWQVAAFTTEVIGGSSSRGGSSTSRSCSSARGRPRGRLPGPLPAPLRAALERHPDRRELALHVPWTDLRPRRQVRADPGAGPHPGQGVREGVPGASSATSSCGSGWATRRRPTRRSSPTCTGWTRPAGSRPRAITLEANYRLLNDNLLDLSHETYVHGKTIGHDSVAESPVAFRNVGNAVHVDKEMTACNPPPFYQFSLASRPPTRSTAGSTRCISRRDSS